MQVPAAIADRQGGFTLEEVEVGSPAPGEVLIAIKASGICHTDWDSLSWGKRHVLGHEGAGEVLACGHGIEDLEPGQAVLLNWAISCGDCPLCRRGFPHLCERHSPVAGRDPLGGHAHLEGTRRAGGEPVERSFHLGTLSGATLVRREAVIAIPPEIEIPFASACILGCGVMTGTGSVFNAAGVEPGSLVAVIGCGGVGLNCIQAARIAGASRIFALDLSEERLAMAKRFGATDCLQTRRDDAGLLQAAEEIRTLTDGRGADYAFEATAVPALGAAPLAMIRHGGTAIQVSGIEQKVEIDMELFEWDKTYLNPLYGQCSPTLDFPRLLDLYRRGALLLDELVTRTYALEDLGQAFEDMHAGRNAKGVVLF